MREGAPPDSWDRGRTDRGSRPVPGPDMGPPCDDPAPVLRPAGIGGQRSPLSGLPLPTADPPGRSLGTGPIPISISCTSIRNAIATDPSVVTGLTAVSMARGDHRAVDTLDTLDPLDRSTQPLTICDGERCSEGGFSNREEHPSRRSTRDSPGSRRTKPGSYSSS
jgi:hypothetical protein